jgi:hypothetical protein
MKITQVLVEDQGVTAAFAFGRFNPAHQGHIEVWRTVEQSGKNWFIGTNPNTLGVDDPLPFEVKTAWMTEIYPPVAGHIVPKTSVLELAAYIFKKLRNNENATVAYITDAQDWAWSGKLLNQYNGVEGGHGYYKFAEIIHVPSPRVTSASELRKAARANNKVAFYQASGTDPKVKVNGKTYFDTVRELLLPYMAAEEEKARAAEQRAQAKAEKERLRAEKAAAKASKIKPTKEGVTEGSEQQWTVTVGTKTGGTSHTMTFAGTKEQAIKKAVARFGTSKDPVVKAVPAKQGVAEGKYTPASETEEDIFIKGKKVGKITKITTKNGMVFYRAEIGNSSTTGADTRQQALRDLKRLISWKNEKGVVEGAPVVVAQAPIDVRNPKKAAQPYRNQGDIVPPTKPPSTEKRGVKGRAGQRPMPEQDVKEASLATMRDYFAGDENAKDPTKLSQMRDFFNKHKPEGRVIDKHFNSKSSYEAWLRQQKMKKIGEDDEAGEVESKFTDYELAVMEGGHSLPEAEKIASRYDPEEFDSMVQRLGKIAKSGPVKTVWDLEKRVYKTVPDTDKQKKIAEAVIKVVEVIKQRKGLWKK